MESLNLLVPWSIVPCWSETGLEAPANHCRKLSLKQNFSIISTSIAGTILLKAMGEMQAEIKESERVTCVTVIVEVLLAWIKKLFPPTFHDMETGCIALEFRPFGEGGEFRPFEEGGGCAIMKLPATTVV